LPIFSFASTNTLADTTLKEEYYTKYDSSLSSEENKEQSINLTFLNSLENAFGKIIASSNDMTISNSIESNKNAISNTSFKSKTKSLVQGKILKIIELFYEKRISEKYIVINGERVKTNTVFNFVRVEFIATEANQPIAFEQEMGNIQKQVDLISEKVEKNTKDISSVKENIEELNKSGGRIMNASTYKELIFNIQNQLTPNFKKEELVFDLINRFPEETKQMLSVNSTGGDAMFMLFSFLNEYGGVSDITILKTIEIINPLLINIEKSNNPDLYSLYLFRKLNELISLTTMQRGEEVSPIQFLKLKDIGDQLISKFSSDESLNLFSRYLYYTLLMGYYNNGHVRNIYVSDNFRTTAGFEKELLPIYKEILTNKTFTYKDRILDQISKGEEWILVNGYGVDTKNSIHNTSIILIDYLHYEDSTYQKSLNFMPFTLKYNILETCKSHKREGGLNYILKFCLKL
jgi:hypothetical protein